MGIQKLIAAFFQTLKSKNQAQRILTAQYFESIINKLGLGRALCDIKVRKRFQQKTKQKNYLGRYG